MSRTEEVNAVTVYEAVQRVALAKHGVWHRFVTVGEVAKACGKSKPTVLKYFKLMMTLDLMELCNPEYRHRGCTNLYKYTEKE